MRGSSEREAGQSRGKPDAPSANTVVLDTLQYCTAEAQKGG